MSFLTGVMIIGWIIALDQHVPDASSPVTAVLILIYAVQDIVRSNR